VAAMVGMEEEEKGRRGHCESREGYCKRQQGQEALVVVVDRV